MDQDISVRLMMLQIQKEGNITFDDAEYIKKYLNLMFGVGFDAGRKDVYARYSKKKTPIIQRDEFNNRVAQYESIAQAARAAHTCSSEIFEALKSHKKTKAGHYWEKVVH